MELISILAATSVYAPVPLALDMFVEDSHLVVPFVHRCARRRSTKTRDGVDPSGRPSLGPLAYRTAESSKQVCALAESAKASLLQADHQISPAAAIA
jgi:hypothetical protein